MPPINRFCMQLYRAGIAVGDIDHNQWALCRNTGMQVYSKDSGELSKQPPKLVPGQLNPGGGAGRVIIVNLR